MKRFIAMFTASLCLLSTLALNVSAELTWEDVYGGLYEFTEEVVSSNLLEYFDYAELYDGYISEDDLPSADTVIKFLSKYFKASKYTNYIVEGQSTSTMKVYRIPRDVFEEILFSKFKYSDELRDLMRNSEYVTKDYKKDYKFTINLEEQNVSDLVCEYYGYKMLDGSKCVAYAKILDFGHVDEYGFFYPYEVSAGDVENCDYAYTQGFWIDVAIPDETATFAGLKLCSAYLPVKMSGYVKVVFELDISANAHICSYEKIQNETIPSDDDIIYDILEYVPEEYADLAYIFGAYVNHIESDFGRDTIVSSAFLFEGECYESAISAVKGGKDSIVYELKAVRDEGNVVPVNDVEVTFFAPFDLSENIGLFMVDEDGSVTQLEYKIDWTYNVITAKLPYLTTVIAARTYTIPEEKPDDTTVQPDETTDPETTTPVTDTVTDTVTDQVTTVIPDNSETQVDPAETDTVTNETDIIEPENPDQRPTSPQTGDNIAIVWVVALIAIVGCITIIWIRKRKTAS